ncbi:hypothetical protein P280DRAFT_456837 [Massarina eburnea CBS 473.64]|uniref:PHD-type domain-containing protein n=1 Tax=Massarina eburnea CBS 473.64 TaxID=1395130 RepID=A0A6A6RSK2_9PLEO|nr:hypothetical protein P280DRAFT_456837 [Massarina eburnea CBS 473.64]
MGPRKRNHAEVEQEEAPVEAPEALTSLQQLRNMWQFANLAQYLHMFKGALKIDHDFGIAELETECLKPQSPEKLAEIGLALLKHISSHKGLTPEIFDEYARRQFVAKAPSRNPFGTDEEPVKFSTFDVFTKVRTLQQLSVWTLNNPNTIRERMNASEGEQLDWRLAPFGRDSQQRLIYLFDDFRLYRQENPFAFEKPPQTKAKSKKRTAKSTRQNKKRRVSARVAEESADDETVHVEDKEEDVDDGLGGTKWECICVDYDDYQNYMSLIRRSKNTDEQELYASIEEHVIPELAKVAEEQAKKEARRQKELETLQKLATAKRSSRISARQDKVKEQEQIEEAERRRLADLDMAKAEQQKQKQQEEAHESHRKTREQRIRERETAKILEEEKLRKLKEDEEKLASGEARGSERYLKAQMRKAASQLKKLKDEGSWMFDCEKCGLKGQNLNDGSHQLQCDSCNEWQHSKCHGIAPEMAAQEDYIFLCSACKQRAQSENEPKLPPLKLRLTSASPNSQPLAQGNGYISTEPPRQLEAVRIPVPRPSVASSPPRSIHSTSALMNGPSLSPRGQALGPPGIQRSEAAYGSPLSHANTSSPTRPVHTGNGYPTSSPPRYHNPGPPTSPLGNPNTSFSRPNGSPFSSTRPFRSTSFANNFGRPVSAAGSASPVKNSPAPSPRPTNGVPNAYNFNSPHSSFPPSSVQASAFSPTKNSSPPPSTHYMSSPGLAPVNFAPSPSQMPAQMLPDPIPAPLKHEVARPLSSHDMSERMILPPIKSLSPNTPFQDLSPPTKKASPTPDRTQFAPVTGNGFQGS